MEVKVLIYMLISVHINLKSDVLLCLVWISEYCQSQLLPVKITVNVQQTVCMSKS